MPGLSHDLAPPCLVSQRLATPIHARVKQPHESTTTTQRAPLRASPAGPVAAPPLPASHSAPQNTPNARATRCRTLLLAAVPAASSAASVTPSTRCSAYARAARTCLSNARWARVRAMRWRSRASTPARVCWRSGREGVQEGGAPCAKPGTPTAAARAAHRARAPCPWPAHPSLQWLGPLGPPSRPHSARGCPLQAPPAPGCLRVQARWRAARLGCQLEGGVRLGVAKQQGMSLSGYYALISAASAARYAAPAARPARAARTAGWARRGPRGLKSWRNRSCVCGRAAACVCSRVFWVAAAANGSSDLGGCVLGHCRHTSAAKGAPKHAGHHHHHPPACSPGSPLKWPRPWWCSRPGPGSAAARRTCGNGHTASSGGTHRGSRSCLSCCL